MLHTDAAVKAWRQGALGTRGVHDILDAVETLDFSTTPSADSLSARIKRVLLLKELLDRLELPPPAEIPGESDVAARGITSWTIPDTQITIVKIKEGTRAGQFLFSAATVEQLDSFYRRARDLPYKATATTPGIYEAFIAAGGGRSLEQPLGERLKRVDASSPRQTLIGFLESIDQAYALVQDAEARLKAKPAAMTAEEAHAVETKVDNLLHRATDLLDLSQFPEAYRHDYAVKAALQLKEVLDRTLAPFEESIPDAQMVEAARKRAAGLSMRAGDAYRWRYPNTEIEIAEVTEGAQRGRFLFTADTVRRAGEFYAKVRDLPYRSELSSFDYSRYEWAGETKGIYDYFVSAPGYLVPEAHFLGRVIDRLPAASKVVYGEQTIWKWMSLLICMVLTVAAAFAVFVLTKRVAERLRSPANGWALTAAPVLVALIVLQVVEFLDSDINLTGRVLSATVIFGKATVAILAVWAVFRLCRALADTVVLIPRIGRQSTDAALVRLGMRIVAFVAGGLIIIYSLRHFGADMVPLLAGLGVGGLAVALAAQRTFANFIGSLILFINKPVKVGDFCRYGDQIGTVEQIGLLATRIRSLERTIVTVPNAEFSEMQIDNFAVRDQRLLKTVLQLRYETTSEQLRYILARLRELLLGHPKVTPAPARVRFVGYGAYSKDLEVFAYLDCEDQDTFLAIQEDILLRMEDIVAEAGSAFAFPSQTAYLARDKSGDPELSSEAEATVKKWRERGKLPFPEFDGDQRQRLENRLDYPPKGSPDYKPPKPAWMQRTGAAQPTFAIDDPVDVPALVARLRQKHGLAEMVHNLLSEETRGLLAAYGGGRDMRLKEALVRDLNMIIRGPSLYDERLFDSVKLREETGKLLRGDPTGEDLAWLNRFLLEDAYPKELAGATQAP
ncbi:MAG TPA: mechanosensitive ion channel domain-containing protein [Sinorhizobium sp.]|nr:mechanosensitive ion channel domain-containing protein [Sinorhizobium sp.]